MPAHEQYRQQVQLLVRLIPLIAPEICFALKGGTAINLFLRDMPRLSVDIDLAYLPIEPRAQSLAGITAALERIAKSIEAAIRGAQTSRIRAERDDALTKLFVRVGRVQVKIEVTPVLRGCVEPPTARRVTPRVEAMFGFAEMQVVSFSDLYAGKIVAALDRQHPRDLFDIRDLLASEGIGPKLAGLS